MRRWRTSAQISSSAFGVAAFERIEKRRRQTRSEIAKWFANTNLDFLLKQKGITHVIVVGLLANTCIGSTARFAKELGYHVTLVRDATAAFSHEMMHAAHELNGPTYAHSILTTAEVIAALPKAALSEENVQ